MRKLVQIVTAAIIGVAFIGSVASAATTVNNCDKIVVTNTGEGSVTNVTCTVNVNATVVCENGIYVLDANSQTAVTGAASVIGNVTSGSAISGSATNSSNQSVQIGASCTTASTSPTPTPTTTTTVSPTPTTTAKATALPNTSSVSAESAIVVGLAVAAVIVAASRLAIAAYRRFTLK